MELIELLFMKISTANIATTIIILKQSAEQVEFPVVKRQTAKIK